MPLSSGDERNFVRRCGGVKTCDVSLRADAGCHEHAGGYELDGGHFVLLEMAATAEGCPDDREAQDRLLLDLLTSRPAVAVSDEGITLTTDRWRATFIEWQPSDPEVTLDGQAWLVVEFFDPTGEWSMAVDRPATLDIAAGTLTGPTGCGTVSVLASGDGILIPESDFVGWCAEATGPDLRYALDLERALVVGEMSAVIDGRVLVLTGPDGFGLTATPVE